MGVGDGAGGGGEGVSPRDSGPCKFPSSALPGAVPVQGPLGLVRQGSAVAMAMGEGGVGGHLKVGFCAQREVGLGFLRWESR